MEGDVVLFNTGWSELRADETDREAVAEFVAGCPGIGMEVASWLNDIGASVAGADTWAVEAVPGEYPFEQFNMTVGFPVHTYCLVCKGKFHVN